MKGYRFTMAVFTDCSRKRREFSNDNIDRRVFIVTDFSFEGKDLCDETSGLSNVYRKKSRGWKVTREDQIQIDALVPYTSYVIVIRDVLMRTDRTLVTNTLQAGTYTFNCKIFPVYTTETVTQHLRDSVSEKSLQARRL